MERKEEGGKERGTRRKKTNFIYGWNINKGSIRPISINSEIPSFLECIPK